MIKSIHQSHLGMYARCAKQFEFRYIEKMILPPGIAARRGSAVHRTADDNYKNKIITGQDKPLEEMQETTRDEYVRLVRDKGVFISKKKAPGKDEQKKLIDEGLDQAISATVVFHDEIAPSTIPKMSEENFTADVGLPLQLGGTVDLIDSDDRIVDLKVMKRKNQAWADSEIQPTFYSVLYQARFDKWPKAFLYDLIIPNKKMVHDQLETKRNDEDVKRLFARIEIFLRALEKGLFPPADPGHWICSSDYCGYHQICKVR